MLTRRIPQEPAARRGFTLLELLIVITVIIALLALLIPAVGMVMTTTRNAAVQTEISDLETKIADFQATFKVDEPFPSRLILYETGTAWGNVDGDATQEALRLQTRAAFIALWPNMRWDLNRDFDGDGTGGEVHILNGAECLVFFLGGMVERTTSGGKTIYRHIGFSKNSSDPFNRSGSNRVGPFLEFESRRLVDIDGDDMPEYLDSLPGQTAPLLYLYSYAGRGYGTYNTANPALYVDFQVGGASRNLKRAYHQALDTSTTPWTPKTAWKPKSYQIISPGNDGEYGVGGKYHPDTADADLGGNDPYDSEPGPDYQNRSMERDNITNFKTGPLGD